MTLGRGTRLGPYEILSAIGEAILEFNRGGTTIGLQATGTSGSAAIKFDSNGVGDGN